MPAKVPLIAPATGSDALRPFNPLVFHTRASYAQELNKIARQLSSTGFTKCAVAYFDNPFGTAAIAAFEAAAKSYKNTDWKAFLVVETPEGIAKGIEEIVAFQPTALMSLAIGGLGIPFYKGLRKRIQTPAFSISFLGSRPLLAALGDAAVGITVAQVVPSPHSVALPLVHAYQSALKKAGGTEPGYSSLEGYVNARILIEALRRSGRTATREKLIDAMHSMRPYDLGGFEVRYGPNDHSGTDFVELTYFNGERFHPRAGGGRKKEKEGAKIWGGKTGGEQKKKGGGPPGGGFFYRGGGAGVPNTRASQKNRWQIRRSESPMY
ncbi:MAG: ABC transporter substrate-binding protein [Simplicispira sp.]|nr:ABC transporter substrate-binding protein [Simplicispira sp.]